MGGLAGGPDGVSVPIRARKSRRDAKSRVRVAVLGTGALGCVYAAALSRVADVIVVGSWAPGVAAIRAGGIRVTDPDGLSWTANVPATDDPMEAAAADFALVLVKSYQTDRAAQWCARLLSRSGLAVSLQNGLDNGPKLAAHVGEDRQAVGVTYLGATLLAPGQVYQVSNLTAEIGANDSTADRVRTLVELLTASGLLAEARRDIRSAIWSKAVANAAINPLTALWRVKNGALPESEEGRRLLADLTGEAAAVAQRKGVRLSYEHPDAFAVEVCRKTAGNRSSMLQDVESGRQTEIDSINGVIVQDGAQLGVPVVANETVWRLVRGLPRSVWPRPPGPLVSQ